VSKPQRFVAPRRTASVKDGVRLFDLERRAADRADALRNRLEDLRRHGTGGNVTLDILIELTEIVASLAVLDRTGEVAA